MRLGSFALVPMGAGLWRRLKECSLWEALRAVTNHRWGLGGDRSNRLVGSGRERRGGA